MKLAVFALSLAPTILLASQPDASLQKAIQKALYRIEPAGNGYSIENPGQRMTARFAAGASQFTYRDHHFSLTLTGAGPVVSTRVEENRIEFEHHGVTEWLVNDPRGIEQGFTVEKRHGAGPLQIVLEVGGDLWPELGGADVILRDGSGAALRYAGLESRDADGHLLSSRAVVENRKILLEVDERKARYPVTVDPWVQVATLTPSDGAVGDYFGYSVAVSGGVAVVGAYLKNNVTGAAYVFTQSGGAWSQQAEITASDGAALDGFGQSVAVSGGTAVVGAPNNSPIGAAYVFTQSGTAWSQQAKLTASDGAAGDAFGNSVAVSGGVAVVGASGAAYVFSQSGTTWSQQTKLTASDGATIGASVAVSGGTAVVGNAYSAAYVFTQSGATWTQQAKLTALDAAAQDLFGQSLAVSDVTAVVGAPGKNSNTGAAYVFTQSGGAWSQQAELTASDGIRSDDFGSSVAVSGGVAVVAAWGNGAAYVFTQSGVTWSQQAEFTTNAGSYCVGSCVAVSGNTVVAGAYGSGEAYVFELANVILRSTPSGRSFTLSGPGCGSTGTFSTPYNYTGFWTNCTVQWTSPDTSTPNTLYLFQNWSDGNSENPRTFTPDPSTAVTYSANFETQYQLTTQASPVAGGTVTPGAFYDAGTVVPISATANSGYSFTSWTGSVANSSSALTTVTMSAPETVIANFLPISPTSITIQTNPPGLLFTVDGGAAQTAPATLSLTQGTHTIALPTPQAGTAGTQYVFTGWSDGGAASHSITVGAAAATYTATFKTQYQLTTQSAPVVVGTVTPASGVFYDAGTVVPITATAIINWYSFSGWTGSVASPNSSSTSVTMNGPQTVTANFTYTAGAQQSVFVSISEYPVGGGDYTVAGPIASGSDGALWFAETSGGTFGAYVQLLRITTAGVVSTPPAPPCGNSLNYRIDGLTAGPDGAMWLTAVGCGGAFIEQITTAGTVTDYPIPTAGGGITAGPDGALWFTSGSAIGRITTAGTITEYAVPTPGGNITAGPDGALWFTESGEMGRITTSGTTLTEYPVPTLSITDGIVAGPDGALWFTESSSGQIGRITAGGVTTQFPVPTGSPQSIAAGPDGALWFTAGAYIGRITTAGAVTEYPAPTAGYGVGTGGIAAGPDGAMWFTESSGPNLEVGQVVIIPNSVPAVLSITKTHAGTFSQAQANATYTLTVSNQQTAGSSSGLVTVTDILPSGLSLVSMAGPGWNCTGNSCTRSDALAGGAAYPGITVTVNVAANASSPQVNVASVSGGGSASASASDSTTIIPNPPVLNITKTHTGNFAQGQMNALYTVTVSNQAGPTNGTVTVTEMPPSGLTLVSMAGTGWTCGGVTCTRSDVLNENSSYPAITVTVNVAANASSPQVNLASVSGGGTALVIAIADSTLVTVGATTVTNVTSSTPNGTYGTPTVISIQVSFSGPVTVTGTPQLALNSGGTANYISGFGSATLNFSYAIGSSDSNSHLDYASTAALTLNGGTILDAVGNTANLTLPTPGATGSLGANTSIWIGMTGPVPAPFFTGQVSLGSRIYYLMFPNGTLFGYYTYVPGSFIYHFDMGYEYVFPANDANGDVYLWDNQSGHWWYTGPSLFPYLYDFTLGTWIYYEPDPSNPGHYTTNPRKFAYTSTHVIFTM